jgi:truncated hemoglobin YjbI
MTKPGTMFERYGGIAFVTRFVLSFYDRVLTSATIAPFFADVDTAATSSRVGRSTDRRCYSAAFMPCSS